MWSLCRCVGAHRSHGHDVPSTTKVMFQSVWMKTRDREGECGSETTRSTKCGDKETDIFPLVWWMVHPYGTTNLIYYIPFVNRVMDRVFKYLMLISIGRYTRSLSHSISSLFRVFKTSDLILIRFPEYSVPPLYSPILFLNSLGRPLSHIYPRWPDPSLPSLYLILPSWREVISYYRPRSLPDTTLP